MKKLISVFILLILLLSACSAVVSPTVPTAAEPGPVDSAPTHLPQPATAKPKGKKTSTAPGAQIHTPVALESSQMVSAAHPDFIATEILGQPENTSVTVNVVPARAMTIFYEYGVSSGHYSARTIEQNAPAGAPLETLLSGLQPNTRYYYRLHYNNQVGAEHSFMTQRAMGSSFTFDLQGDSHPERVNKQFNADLYEKTLRSAASDQPDFYLCIGDDFSVDQLKTVNADTVRALYIQQRQWLGQVEAPVFLVNGNHEQAALANLNGSADNVAVWAQTSRNAYYPQPAPDNFYSGDSQPVEFIGQLRDYYAFTWGNALFVVIDPYWHSNQTVDNTFGVDDHRTGKGNRDLWNNTLGDVQYQWFKNVLETSTAPYKFVFTHHVLGTGRGGIEEAGGYEWGDAANLAAHRPDWTRTIQQLMADNHVTIFFQGHDHLFAHQELDGVVYQTLPEPANPYYTVENADAYRSGDLLPNSGHVRVNVSPDGVRVDYVRSYLDKPDEVAFSYSLPSAVQ